MSRLLAIALAATACLLRMWAASGELWLDEVWSIQLAEQITAPWQILTQLRSDNNHMLNTAYVGWLGSDQPLFSYRLVSIAAGTLSMFAAGAIAAERGPVERLTAMLLVGTSFLMVHYAAEARGYALVMLLALVAYWCLRKFLQRSQHRYAVCFALSASLGFLAHPTFIFLYVAVGFWSVTSLTTTLPDWRSATKSLLTLHALPCGLALLLYAVNLQHLELGGGPDYNLVQVLSQAGSLAVGGPSTGLGATIGAILFASLVAGGLWLVWRDQDQQWITLACCVLLPVVAVVVSRAPFLFVRYFLVAILFGQLLVAFALAWLQRQGRVGRVAFAVLLAGFVAANLSHLIGLHHAGRGQYLAALQFIADQESGPSITIGSNHDHGTSILIDFYRHRLATTSTIVYRPAATWTGTNRPAAAAPDWLILHHDPGQGPADYQASYLIEGQTYRLSKMFDAAILSGWQWYCYRKDRQEAPLAGIPVREMVNVATATDR